MSSTRVLNRGGLAMHSPLAGEPLVPALPKAVFLSGDCGRRLRASRA